MALEGQAGDRVASGRGLVDAPRATCRVGYLVPEFPGQTHLFFWRELQGLSDAGVDCELISTRPPPNGVVSHNWASEVIGRTTYLSPLGIGDLAGIIVALLKAGPARLARCASVIGGKSDLSFKDRAWLLMLMLPAAKLVRIAREKELDHVHVQSCGDAANVAMLASLISSMTYSLSLLGPTLEGYGRNQANKWRFSSFAVVMSDLLYKVVLDRLAKSLPSDVFVLPVGVDLDVMHRAARYEPWAGTGACRIYSCGRLNQIKGHRDLIDAVSILHSRGIPVELSIAGEDEQGGQGYRRELERHLEKTQAGTYVKLLGAIGEDQHRVYLQESHIFALASLNEGISVAIMEAMAMQTPVVVTNVGGNSELVDDGVTGILVEPENPAQFADALESVLHDKAFAMRLSQQSRRTVSEKFNSRMHAATLARHLFAMTSKFQRSEVNSSGR
jgi:glycosyltransferase involved in cell wall biosynthesis